MLGTSLAPIAYANHTICYALKKQGAEEAATLLLGSMSQVRREREAEARDDPSRVSPNFRVSACVGSYEGLAMRSVTTW